MVLGRAGIGETCTDQVVPPSPVDPRRPWAGADGEHRELRTPRVAAGPAVVEWLARNKRSEPLGLPRRYLADRFRSTSLAANGARLPRKRTSATLACEPVSAAGLVSDFALETDADAATLADEGEQRHGRGLFHELRRRRLQHPRLRWPRLATPGQNDQDSRVGIVGEKSESEETFSWDIDVLKLSDPSEWGEYEPPSGSVSVHEDFDPSAVVTFPGNIFFPGGPDVQRLDIPDPVPVGTPRRSEGKRPESTSSKRPESKGNLSMASTAYRSTEGGDSSFEPPWSAGSLLNGSPGTPSTTVLQRARSRMPPAAGATWTVRAPEERPEDERWKRRRMPPVSGLFASFAAGGEPEASDVGEASEEEEKTKFINFENWGLDDAYLKVQLGSVLQEDASQLRHINLSHNRLTARCLDWIARSRAKLLTIDMAGNKLHALEKLQVQSFVRRVCPELRELDLSDCQIGDAACSTLCVALGRNSSKTLTRLVLARNGLGDNKDTGAALGNLLVVAKALTVLDLHWNRFRGQSGQALMEGVYDNSCVYQGQLRRLDLSWNNLGTRCGSQRQQVLDGGGAAKAPGCSCATCANVTKMMRSLAATFQDGTMLFHLDLSYNFITSADCAVLAKGLRSNDTLFGIHLIGNEAMLDPHGFVVPRVGGDRASVLNSMEQLSDAVRDSRKIHRLHEEHEAARREKLRTPRSRPVPMRCMEPKDALPSSQIERAVERNVSCCWICERWVECEVVYIPSWSGPERSLEEVEAIQEVFVFFSVDGFQKPTLLTKVVEPFVARLCMTKAGKRLRTRDQRSLNSVIRDENDHLVRWVGSRMLPPSQEPLHAIFQVNESLVTARDMHEETFFSPQRVVLAGSVAGEVAETSQANAVHVCRSLVDGSSKGLQMALCVFEDPECRGQALVKPRTLAAATVPKTKPWSMETSVFGSYAHDSVNTMRLCFEHDWAMSKLPRFIPTRSQEMLCDVIRPAYAQIMAAYNFAAFGGHRSARACPSLPRDSFLQVLKTYTNDLELLTCGHFGPEEIDHIFLVASIKQVSRQQKRNLPGMAGSGLARFQFLEALVQIALKRAISGVHEPVEAFEAFLRATQFGADALARRRQVHKSMFTEKFSRVCQEFDTTLRSCFQRYKSICRYPGRKETDGLTFGAWLQLMHDANVQDITKATRKQLALAFAYGRSDRADDLTSFGHMELTYAEFIVAVGSIAAIVFEDSAYLGDVIAELIEDCLKPCVANADSPKAAGLVGHELLSELVEKIFRASGCLETCEPLTKWKFVQALSQQQEVLELAQHLGLDFGKGELLVFFQHLDADMSGEVTVAELCEGMSRWQKNQRLHGVSRAIFQLRKIFMMPGRSGSSVLDIDEFREFFYSRDKSVQLQRLGISVADVEDIYEELSRGSVREVDESQVFAALLRLRDPGAPVATGMWILQQAFTAADVGSSGLNRTKVATHLCSRELTAKLRKACLQVPNWLTVFDDIDGGKGGELTWVELRQAAEALWCLSEEQLEQHGAVRALRVGSPLGAGNRSGQPSPRRALAILKKGDASK